MAEYFDREWTGTTSDPWEDLAEGWALVVGNQSALINSNVGECGSTGEERIYRATSFAHGPDYKVSVDLDWANATGATRRAGIAVRVTGNGDVAYVAEIDSNHLGNTRARIRRRRGGAFTDVVSWQDISADVPQANLDLGVTAQLRVETLSDGTVDLDLIVDGTTVIDANDSDAAAILSGGGVGVIIGPNCTGNDITFDNLVCEDFEDEATASPAELGADVALVIDSKHYSWQELADAGITVGIGRSSYTLDTVWSFRDRLQFQDASGPLYPGAVVQVALDGTVVAFGRVRATSTNAKPGEGHSFELYPPKKLAQDVVVSDPETKALGITWNAPTTHEDYEPSRAGQSLRAVIKWVLDTFLEGDGGLRQQLAAPATGTAYVDADLADSQFDLEVPQLVIRGDVARVIETLLSFTSFAVRIDPATLKWRFQHRLTGTLTEIDIAADHVEAEISVNTDRNYTQGIVVGSRPEVTTLKLSSDGSDPSADGTISEGWDSGLQSTNTREKQFKNRDEGVVASTGTAGGKVTMDPSPTGPPAFSMEANEWEKTDLRFVDGAEAGNTYRVESNDTGTLTLTATSWTSGGPTAGDSFVLEGAMKNGGKDNGHKNVGRRWVIDDTDLEVPDGACVEAKIWSGALAVSSKAYVEPDPESGSKQAVNLDVPAIGLINSTTANDPCAAGDVGDVATVELNIPTVTRSTKDVPRVVRPGEGEYTGTAYTLDSSKWAGGGEPGKGDPGVMRPLILTIPEFTGGAAQVAAYEQMLDSMLEILSPLAKEVRVTIKGTLDTSWLDLNKRIRLVDGSGNRTMGDLATWTDVPVQAVEWDPYRNTTTLYGGSQSAQQYDLQALRRAFQIRNRLDNLDVERRNFQDLLACVKNAVHGGGDTPGPHPNADCSEHISSGVMKEDSSVKEDIETIKKVLETIADILEFQKGGTFSVDGNDNLWYTRDDGEAFWLDDNGAWHKDDGDGIPDAGTDPVVSDPWEGDPNNMGGVEGESYDKTSAILDVLAAQKGGGFTWEADDGDSGVLWYTDKDGTKYWWDDSLNGGDGGWRQDDGDSVPEASDPEVDHPWASGPGSLGGLEGAMWAAIEGLLANIGKTIDTVTGEVIAPGTENNVTNNPDGNPWNHYGPGGTTAVPNGGTVPPTTLGGALANLNKHVDDEGNVLEPGDSVPAGGAELHGLDDSGNITPIALSSGHTTPGNQRMLAEALVEGVFGFTVDTREDPAGIVWTD